MKTFFHDENHKLIINCLIYVYSALSNKHYIKFTVNHYRKLISHSS